MEDTRHLLASLRGRRKVQTAGLGRRGIALFRVSVAPILGRVSNGERAALEPS